MLKRALFRLQFWRRLLLVPIWIVLGLCALPNQAKAQAEIDAPLLLELTDTTLIARIWEIVYPDSLLPQGEYQILLLSGPEILEATEEIEGEAFLLRNGTQIGRLDRAAWQQAASVTLRERGEGWISTAEGADRQEVPLLWKAFKFNKETLLAWAEWPSGLLLNISSAISALPTAKPQAQRDIDFLWSQKVFGHYLLGWELHNTQYGGGLTRSIIEANRLDRLDASSSVIVDEGTSPFWGSDYWSWGLTLGVPGLKYTLSLANQPLPKYFWLESRATKAIEKHQRGRVIKQWTGNSLAIPGNLAQTFETRLGYLRYGLHIDNDAYRMPVQTLAMDEMPALFGTWGMGLVMASSIMATRVWMDIPDLNFTFPLPRSYPTKLRIAFIHLDLAYRSVRNLSLGVSVRVHIDNPIMKLPGV